MEKWPPSRILEVLDQCAEDFTFPMLDNGYVYLAATRLSLFRSDTDWALVIEVFGFSPRSGLPDLHVHTFGSRLHDRDPASNYVSEDAHRRYLAANPYDEARFFSPISDGPWQDSDSSEFVAKDATTVSLRGEPVAVPSLDELEAHGIEPSEPDGLLTFELCRHLAVDHRSRVLGSDAERRVSVPPELDEILVLDAWHHPDLVQGELPSESETFQQLAQVLATGSLDAYAPSNAPNTHWSNWPDGGTL